MKKYLLKILFAFIFFSFSCNKDSDTPEIVNTTLTGKWIEIESLIDPGDGSGKWQPTNKPNNYIEFNADSTIKSNAFPDYVKYKVGFNSAMTITLLNGNFIERSYKITGNSLTLMGGCFEACGYKFIKYQP